VSASDDDGDQTQASASATVSFTDVLPAIAVTKTAAPAAVPESGDVVEFTLSVENLSAEPVMLMSVVDSAFPLDVLLPGWLGTVRAPSDGVPGGGGNCFVYHDVARDGIRVRSRGRSNRHPEDDRGTQHGLLHDSSPTPGAAPGRNDPSGAGVFRPPLWPSSITSGRSTRDGQIQPLHSGAPQAWGHSTVQRQSSHRPPHRTNAACHSCHHGAMRRAIGSTTRMRAFMAR
jgi:hypothetical protein